MPQKVSSQDTANTATTMARVPERRITALAMDSVRPLFSRKQPSSCPPRNSGNMLVTELATPSR